MKGAELLPYPLRSALDFFSTSQVGQFVITSRTYRHAQAGVVFLRYLFVWLGPVGFLVRILWLIFFANKLHVRNWQVMFRVYRFIRGICIQKVAEEICQLGQRFFCLIIFCTNDSEALREQQT